MGETIRGLKMLCRRNIGFAFFLAWNYIALYGCGHWVVRAVQP